MSQFERSRCWQWCDLWQQSDCLNLFGDAVITLKGGQQDLGSDLNDFKENQDPKNKELEKKVGPMVRAVLGTKAESIAKQASCTQAQKDFGP